MTSRRHHEHHHLFLLALALAVVFLVSGDPPSAAGQCLPDQRAALLRLKNNFTAANLSSWQPKANFSSWQPNTDCCSWDGVHCGGGGEVTALDLAKRSLAGKLDSALFNLTSLQCLSLAYNQFDGIPLPSAGFERLVNLTYLNLSNAGFAGQVPTGIARLVKLVTLDLSAFVLNELPNTSLVLKHPTFEVLIANLTNLQKLYLDGVNMSTSSSGWAQAVANAAPSLRELSLSGCSLTGPIDQSLAGLRNLSKLHLDQNNLSCAVPEFFTEFSSLSSLTFRSCGLKGVFPKRIFQIKNLAAVDLSNNPMLSGELPEFVEDSALESLVIVSTNFSREIPDSIRNLKKLSTLKLTACQFGGVIPSSVSELQQLVRLDLSFNNFSGGMPNFVQWPLISEIILSVNNINGSLPPSGYKGLRSLTKIDLQNNTISGPIPASLFSLPSLRLLQLSQNNFSGNLVEFSNTSSTLQTIDLSGNNLQGPIPKSLFELSGLTVLNLASNSFSGTVELDWILSRENLSSLDFSNNRLSVMEGDGNSSFASYPSISTLRLVSCNLTKLPGFLKYQNEISTLDLSSNNIDGAIPQWIWSIGVNSLNYLNLSHNSFTSVEKPVSNVSLISTIILDLHSNKLQGSLPLPPPNTIVLDYSNNSFTSSFPANFVSCLRFAIFVSFSGNNLTGEIPPAICNGSYLQVLDLSYNNLSGSIPPCLLEGSSTLAVLNLRGNQLSGSVPDNIGKGCGLRTINLGSNKLDGRLPTSLAHCGMLEVLDIGSNQVMDSFPYWLGNLSRLRVLVLTSNEFYGPVGHPAANGVIISPIPMLQILDLSLNKFDGDIPAKCFRNLKAMMASSVLESPTVGFNYLGFENTQSYYQDSVTVAFKGQEITFVKILSVFTSVDLSGNRFNGSIPSEIGELKLLKLLNLSSNAFSGGIPSQFASLMQLESLDLSLNHLSGGIPPGLTALTFLAYLNLSYNNLVGRIPQDEQFATFSNQSYLGNKGLCGSPLSQQCSVPVPIVSPSKSSLNLDWQFILIGFGFGSGLAFVVVPLMVWSKGRRWYNKHVDKLLLAMMPECYSCKIQRVASEEWDSGEMVEEEEEEEDDPKFCLVCTGLEFIGDRIVIQHVECSCNVSDS